MEFIMCIADTKEKTTVVVNGERLIMKVKFTPGLFNWQLNAN